MRRLFDAASVLLLSLLLEHLKISFSAELFDVVRDFLPSVLFTSLLYQPVL